MDSNGGCNGMKLLSQTMKGFFHFDETPIGLDLRELPDGLIAVLGPNGAGKTSAILDTALAGIYGAGVQNRAFPSRDGTLFSYATSSDAYIETLWQIGDRMIRARVNVDGPKRKADAVLEEIDATGVARRLSDGLVATFRGAVAEVFPSQRSLLASAFSAQNKRGGFGELGQKERMELFVELADLAHYEASSETARRCFHIANDIATKLCTARDVLRSDATPEMQAAFATEIERLAGALAIVDDELAVAEADVARFETERGTYTENVRQYTAALARREELRVTAELRRSMLEAAETSAGVINVEHAAEVVRIVDRRGYASDGIETHLTMMVRAYDAATKDRNERIENNRKLVGDADVIRGALVDLAAARELRKTLSATIDTARARREVRESQVAVRHGKLGEARRAETALVDARRRSALIATVKFGDECGVAPACPLVTDAFAAREKIVEFEAVAANAEILQDGIALWQGRVDAIKAQEADLNAQVVKTDRMIATLESASKMAPHLDAAETRIAEYERDAESAERTHAESVAALSSETDAVMVASNAEVVEAEKRRDARLAEADRVKTEREAEYVTALGALGAASESVETFAGDRARLATVEIALSAARGSTANATARQGTLRADAGVATSRAMDVQKKLARAEVVETNLRTVEDEALSWKVLARACGRDGLQRLEIDAAGPVVADLANQLLRVGYGARFSVDIVTQVATADAKDVKEKFTVLVLDNDYGGESRDVGDLSGGERVVVEEALRAALSCYVSLKSRQPSRTIWRDETTGALDTENAPRYIEMLRKLKELSGADQILFITHSDACAALADAQVRVGDGKATVVLPPFGAAR